MGNNAFKKQQAIRFNENRLREKREAEVLALDKIENPEKYARSVRRHRKLARRIVPFIAMASALSV